MKVSVIGATGYAGAELLRLLHNHPEAEVMYMTSESHAGEPISQIYPHLRGIYEQKLISMKEIADMAAFLASDLAPHISGQSISVDGNFETYRGPKFVS